MPFAGILEVVQWAVAGKLVGAGGTLLAGLRALSQAVAPLVVASLWQGAAVAVGLAICLRLAPRITAAHRFALWASSFVALVCLAFVPLLSHLSAGASANVSSGIAQAAPRPWLQLDLRWSLAIAALWAAASLLRAADLAVHTFRLRTLWKTAIPVELDGRVNSAPANVPALLSRARVRICTTQSLQRPSVIGFFAPRILIPDWLFVRLTPGELEQIVLHESEHLRRGDDWTNLLQKLCLVLFPLNPALWWIERRLCQEREMACDEGVVKVTHAPRAYAACLASLAERRMNQRAEALSLGAWQRRSELVHRVHSILLRKHALNPVATRALLGTLGCGLLFGTVELARCPQLIAFVPAQKMEMAQAKPLESAAGTSAQRQGLIRTAYELHPKRRTASSVRSHSASSSPTMASLESNARRLKPAASEPEPVSSELAFTSPSRNLLKAVETAAHTSDAPAAQPQAQQWIVLTTWEQVEPVNRQATRSADYDTAQGAEQAASGAKGQQKTPVAGRITVTRLIFKVLPATSPSGQPIVVPVRSGWLVIQL